MISNGQSFCCQSTPCCGVIVAQASGGAPLGVASTEMRKHPITNKTRHPATNGSDRFDSIMSPISIDCWKIWCLLCVRRSEPVQTGDISQTTNNIWRDSKRLIVFWCRFVFPIYQVYLTNHLIFVTFGLFWQSEPAKCALLVQIISFIVRTKKQKTFWL